MQVLKSDERRAGLLEKLADHVIAHGLAASGLRALATAVGTSDRMLLYYFRDKAELMGATLEHIAARLTTELLVHTGQTPQSPAMLWIRLEPLLLSDALWPYMRLWLDIASRAAYADSFYRDIGERIGRGFVTWTVAQLEGENEATRAVEAVRLIVMIEGVVVLKSIGLEDIARSAMRTSPALQ